MRYCSLNLFIWATLSGATLLICASSVRAQEPVKKPLLPAFTLDSDVRLREEARSASSFAGGSNPQDAFNRVRLGMRYRDRNGWMLFLQPQFSYENHWGVSSALGSVNNWDIHQGFLEMPTAKGRLRVGRQELVFGEERLIGAAGWGALGRSFDALRWTVGNKRSTTDLFMGKLGQATGKSSEPLLMGIYSNFVANKTNATDVYLLLKADRVTGSPQEVWTLGARPKFAFGKGFDATIEAAAQFGRNAGKSISAWAYSANVGYTFPGKAGWRLAIERNAASGGDPNDPNAYHTFDQLFSTNHFHYGVADYVGWRNMENWRLSLKGKIAPNWTVALDGHLFGLSDARDFWYGDGGRPVKGADGKALRSATGAAGRDLGAEIDIQFHYTVNKQMGIQFGFGRFMPGSFVRQTNKGLAAGSDWFFIQPTFRF